MNHNDLMLTMNPGTISPENDAGVYGSESDTNSDDLELYYQPVLAAEIDGDGEGRDGDSIDQDLAVNYEHLPNGYVENGVGLLDSSDGDDENEGEPEEEIESETAIERAFREDDRRRNAPLPAENSVRVIEAMRGVSFDGAAPAWVGQIPEEQWIDRIRRLRRSDAVEPAAADN